MGQRTVEVIEQTTCDQAAQQPGVTWLVSDTSLLHVWYQLREAWLNLPKGRRRIQSVHTRAAYERATRVWFEYLAAQGVQPWEASSPHVRAWIEWLAACGASPATVGLRVAACSSFYTFVIREKHLVGGVEVSAFIDASGKTRDNPFRTGNVVRPALVHADQHPLSQADVQRLLSHLESREGTLYGSRNHALLLTHFLTGCRASEVCRLRWADIRPNKNQPGGWVFRWKGKGDKQEISPLPARAYAAICNHLRVAGRHPETLLAEEYIFKPLAVHGLGNFGVEAASEHIGAGNVQRIFQASLRAAGVKEWKQYRVHDLRRTMALTHYGLFKDVRKVQKLLHHESIETTMRYLQEFDDPVDSSSEAIYQQGRFGGV